jgi:hypothetical protein
MSAEDRKVHSKANDDPEESTEDVEAHIKGDRGADVRGDRGADVRGDRGADDDGGDDVEAHVRQSR